MGCERRGRRGHITTLEGVWQSRALPNETSVVTDVVVSLEEEVQAPVKAINKSDGRRDLLNRGVSGQSPHASTATKNTWLSGFTEGWLQALPDSICITDSLVVLKDEILREGTVLVCDQTPAETVGRRLRLTRRQLVQDAGRGHWGPRCGSGRGLVGGASEASVEHIIARVNLVVVGTDFVTGQVVESCGVA